MKVNKQNLKKWAKEKVTKEIKNYFELNKNENSTSKYWDIVKSMLRWKFKALISTRDTGSSETHDLILLLKKLEKEDKNKY